MGVWFAISEALCGVMIVLTYIDSDKEFVTTVLWDKTGNIIGFKKFTL